MLWNTMILPILTSLTATGLGIFMVWLFNRKRQSDERVNQIAHILNEINDIRNKIANSLERSELETAKNEKFRDDVKEEIHAIREDVRNINEQVSENRASIEKNRVSIEKNRASIEKNKALIEKIDIQVSENRALIEKINIQVSENRDLIQGTIDVVGELQSVVGDIRDIVQGNIPSRAQ